MNRQGAENKEFNLKENEKQGNNEEKRTESQRLEEFRELNDLLTSKENPLGALP